MSLLSCVDCGWEERGGVRLCGCCDRIGVGNGASINLIHNCGLLTLEKRVLAGRVVACLGKSYYCRTAWQDVSVMSATVCMGQTISRSFQLKTCKFLKTLLVSKEIETIYIPRPCVTVVSQLT